VSDRPTPETDAARHDFFSNFGPIPCSYGDWVPVNVSARLERERDDVRTLDFERMKQERDEARRQCLKWLEEWHLTDRARCDMKSERDEARSQRNALAASLEYIASAGLTAQHYEDEAKKMLALAFEKEGGV
jgi:hypothetical protein